LKRIALALALAAALAAEARPGHAAGAWSTFLHPSAYGGIVAASDTVWGAAVDGGVVFYVRSSGQFGSYSRQPGGLASNNLTAIAADRSGNLWFGTSDAGVSRLASDGTWGVLNAFDGLPSLTVNTLRASGDSLWIGTSAGLAVYDGTEISGRLPDSGAPSPFASNNITGIALTGDSVWVATAAGVYYARRSEQLSSWTQMSAGLQLLNQQVDGLATDGVNVWALAYQQLLLATAASIWSPVSGLGAVYRVSDESGRVVASTNTGVFEYQGGAWTLHPGSPPSDGATTTTYAATADPTGVVVAAAQAGVLIEPASGAWPAYLPPGPTGNNVQNVLVDGARVYVATFDEGMARYNGQNWNLWYPSTCTANCDHTFYNTLYSFALLRDRLGQKWVGCWGEAVDRMDDSGPIDSVTHVLIQDPNPQSPPNPHTWLWSAAADSNGGVWFGGDSPDVVGFPPIGIDYYNPSGLFRRNYQPSAGDTLTGTTSHMAGVQVRSLFYDDRQRTFWVGYAGAGVQSFPLPVGADRVTPDTTGQKLQFHTLLDANRLDVFAVIPHGDSIWVFDTNDLRLYPEYGSTNTSTAYSIPAGPAPRGALHPLDVAADGTVWLGTTNGVRAYHPGGTTEDFTTANSPLANDEVRTVRIDPVTGAIWFATATGLNRYDPNYRPPPAPPLPYLQARVYPNPVPIANLIGTSLHIIGNAPSYGGRVYSVEGRLVRRLPGAANGKLLWDGRDENGSLVKPGLYFVRIDAGGRQMTARVTLLR